MTSGLLAPADTVATGRALPEGWRWVRLGDVCELNPRRPPLPGRHDEAPTSFVPMSGVDDQLGVVARPEVKAFGAVRKGYTYFTEGDVLFAKITPCMQNGKHAIANELVDAIRFGSTEFHVIRPGPDVTSAWVHHFIRQPAVLQDATAYMTGAVGQQRVPQNFLASVRLPLPPLAEQRRIAAILGEQLAAVERARAAAEAQLGHISSLPAALLRQALEGGV